MSEPTAVQDSAIDDIVADGSAPLEAEIVVDGEGESGDEGEGDDGAGGEVATKKKKKKTKKKKKAGGANGSSAEAKQVGQQSEPPTIGLSKLFPTGAYPTGETHEYQDDNAYRTTSEEKRHLEKVVMQEDASSSAYNYNSIRRAAEVHRQVRQYAQRTIKPGMTMTSIANLIEDATRALTEVDGRQHPELGPGHPLSGIGFPTGLSLNHVAAHYTPNAGDTKVLQESDVLKVDIGVQINGRIADSAFTLNFDHKWDRLLEAVKDATNTGIREAGIDVRLGGLGGIIQEVMESYEVEVDGKTHQVRPIRTLSGHTIVPWSIHGGKSVPIVRTNDQTKMEEGDYFAIETFGSTGRGEVHDEGEVSHYARIFDLPKNASSKLRLASSKKILNTINREFGSLPFCRRYLDRIGEQNYLLGLRELVNNGIVHDYPPLADVKGCMTAQFEHTILLRPTCKEVVTRGDDY